MCKIAAIIQARMGSTRLQGKIMLDLGGQPVLWHVAERLKRSTQLDEIIIATTTLTADDVVEELSLKMNVKCYRGSEGDVLERYYLCAEQNNVDIIARITADCPLIDPFILDYMILYYKHKDVDIVTNAVADISQRTYPRGLDIEIFAKDRLYEAYINARENYQREHVTPYIYENAKSLYVQKSDIDYSNLRWTLDTDDDFKLISAVYNHFYRGKHDFYFNDIVEFFNQNPQIVKLNEHVEQKKIR